MNKKGFTLIEMLIVIAIIAILSSVFLVGLRGFRGGAYDARRLADLQKTQSYLELFYTKHRCYPGSDGADDCVDSSNFNEETEETVDSNTEWEAFSAGLLDDINVVIPNDPLAKSEQHYYYGVSKDRQSYVLGAELTPGHSAYSETSAIDVSTYGVACDTGETTEGETTVSTPIFCIKF